MKSTRPKLLPTLVCLAIVGITAAVLPHPGLSRQTPVVSTNISK